MPDSLTVFFTLYWKAWFLSVFLLEGRTCLVSATSLSHAGAWYAGVGTQPAKNSILTGPSSHEGLRAQDLWLSC